MSWLDIFLLGGTVLFALALLIPRQAWPRLSLGIVGLLASACTVQLLIEGFDWQFLPAYLLILGAGCCLAGKRAGQARPGLLARASVAAAVAAMGVCWVFVPVPELPGPGGPYAVGTEVFRWEDPVRPEPATDLPEDKRNIIAQAWYPAASGSKGRHAPYIDGLGHLPRFVSAVPSLLMARYDRIDTHAVVGAPVSSDQPKWPVLLFSPGYGASRAFYTSLVSDLASRGFVVLAIDHAFEAAVTMLADGRLATPVERFAANDPYRLAYMREHLEIRAQDLRAVLDQLDRRGGFGALSQHLDLERIAAIGHSFGGAAAVAIMAEDSRVKAAANIDGTLYGTLAERRLSRPFLLIESDHGETGHSALYLDGNQRLISNLQSDGFRYQISGANHYSFTDASQLFSPPARWLLAHLMGGSRGLAETRQATNDILAAFLQGPLNGRTADVEAAAGRHRNIQGGQVKGRPTTLTMR